MNAVKNLSTKLQMTIIGCGLPTAFNALHSDPQVENRFYPMELPAWTYGEEFKRLLTSLEARLLLREPSNLSSAPSARVIHSRTGGLLGEVIALLVAASEMALQEGRECITGKDLSSSDYLGPEERRKRFVTQ
jgi:Bacterial TniB protein